MTCMGRDDVKRRRTVNPLARMSPPPVAQRDIYLPTNNHKTTSVNTMLSHALSCPKSSTQSLRRCGQAKPYSTSAKAVDAGARHRFRKVSGIASRSAISMISALPKRKNSKHHPSNYLHMLASFLCELDGLVANPQAFLQCGACETDYMESGALVPSSLLFLQHHTARLPLDNSVILNTNIWRYAALCPPPPLHGGAFCAVERRLSQVRSP
jgi:hypothetical protein